MVCSKCIHWDNKTNSSRWYTQDEANRSSFGYCIKILRGYLVWEVSDDVQNLNPTVNSIGLITDNQAIVENDKGWGIITGKNFGCMLYEQKDDDTNST